MCCKVFVEKRLSDYMNENERRNTINWFEIKCFFFTNKELKERLDSQFDVFFAYQTESITTCKPWNSPLSSRDDLCPVAEGAEAEHLFSDVNALRRF